MRAARTTVLALLLASLGAGASASSALEHARQRGRLIIVVDYVIPEYKAGTKFRTPETIDTALAEDLARRMHLPLAVERITPAVDDKEDIVLTTLADSAKAPSALTVIPTGYVAGPMAIMRSDTTIQSWEQLRGRTVCISEGGHYAGTLAARYGAVEKLYRAPADALLALRTGQCDATVHDSAMLEELIKLPEWKKFSASLHAGPQTQLAFIVPAQDKQTITALKQSVREWAAQRYPDSLMKKAVRNIAFEVYLDQDVPDCH